MTEPLSREQRVEMMTKNVEAVRKSTHPGQIAAGVTASLCSAIFDLADAFNNIADALRESKAGKTINITGTTGVSPADLAEELKKRGRLGS